MANIVNIANISPHVDSEAYCTVILFTQHIQIHPQQANGLIISEWIKQHLNQLSNQIISRMITFLLKTDSTEIRRDDIVFCVIRVKTSG